VGIKLRRLIAGLVAVLATGYSVVATTTASAPAIPRPVQTSLVPALPITITGVDAHDGTIYQDAGTYYLIGTRYSCAAGNFNWGTSPTTWCGYAAYSAPAASGPWTYVRQLFPVTDVSPYNGTTWQHTCGDEGQGCFNPRMAKRPDGVWVLWFNASYDEVHYGANGYYVMGCNGPIGPCGASAGPPYGSTSKPGMWKCNNSGDFSIVVDGTQAWMVCNTNTYTLATERLDSWWANGNTTVGVRGVAGLTFIEGEGAFKADDGTWFVTYSDPACGYCAGTATGYAVAPSLAGPWTWPQNATSANGDMTARRKVSAHSCGGQPRTVVTLDGQPYQYIDLWHGGHNETTAGIHLEPLFPVTPYTVTPAGALWMGGLRPFTCE
jgi:hypothetical protein